MFFSTYFLQISPLFCRNSLQKNQVKLNKIKFSNKMADLLIIGEEEKEEEKEEERTKVM